MMFFVWAFCLLLASDSAAQVISAESSQVSPDVSFKGFPSQSCFSSRPYTHYVCPVDGNIVPKVVLIFSYNCKFKRQETQWFLSTNATPSVLAKQIADQPMTVMNPAFDPNELRTVQECLTCLRFERPVKHGRDEGTYVVKTVVDGNEEISSEVKIISYDVKNCPKVQIDPLTITVNSQPLTRDTVVTVDDTLELTFDLPTATPPLRPAVYVAQKDFNYVRHQLRHTCDPSTRRCTAKVKASDRVVPKVFHFDEESTSIQIILLIRYMQMQPFQFKNHFTLINPNFKKRHS